MFKVFLTMGGMILSILFVVSVVSAEPSGDIVYTAPETTVVATETTIPVPEETAIETPATAEETEAETESYYNVNLPEYVQDIIFAECEKYSIPPSIVIAMIERESWFDRYAIGDDGRSFGLMQVQPKEHLQRMINLGCTDLFDPIQNVKVGIDILGELYNTYGVIGAALTAYNCGSYNGTLTNYATSIMARANEVR